MTVEFLRESVVRQNMNQVFFFSFIHVRQWLQSLREDFYLYHFYGSSLCIYITIYIYYVYDELALVEVLGQHDFEQHL